MAFEEILVAAALLLVLFIFLYSRQRKKSEQLLLQLNDLISKKQSLSTKYGRMTEQFFPFLENYPYDAQNFRFIGSPVDGVQFETDKIIFVEFKAGNHPISAGQKEVKELVEKGKVEFREIRMK